MAGTSADAACGAITTPSATPANATISIGICENRCIANNTNIVVPAKAGTHNHRLSLLRESRQELFLKTTAAEYGSLLAQGRQSISFPNPLRRPRESGDP